VRPIAVPYLWRILNLINLTSTENDYDAYLFKTFDISIDELKSEIRLLKYIPNTEMLKGSSTVMRLLLSGFNGYRSIRQRSKYF